MRIIDEPLVNYSGVLETCINSITSTDLRDRLDSINARLILEAQGYAEKASLADLFLINQFVGDNHDLVVDAVTKQELKDLYSLHMVPQSKPARVYYDELKFSSPLNCCPFCGFGHVSTLDHYLPKSKFPLMSVLPINLVPSCADCNKGKSAGIASLKSEQCLHPYFDRAPFISDQWVFAEVVETGPASLKFKVNPPATWEEDDKARVKAHFTDFELGDRFAIQAAHELSNLREELKIDFPNSGVPGVTHDLEKRALASGRLHQNSWKTAMYQALASNVWYCSGGFAEE